MKSPYRPARRWSKGVAPRASVQVQHQGFYLGRPTKIHQVRFQRPSCAYHTQHIKPQDRPHYPPHKPDETHHSRKVVVHVRSADAMTGSKFLFRGEIKF